MEKTLLITIDFWPKVGGVANYYLNLCQNLDKEKIVVLTCGSGKDDLGFKIIRKNLLINWLWPKWLVMFWQIWQVVKEEKITKLWAGEVLPTGTVVYYLSKILKLPYIVSCHGMDILQAQQVGRKKRMAKKILQQAEWVTVNSHYTADLTREIGAKGENIKVVYPAINNKQLTVDRGIKEEFIKKYNLEGKKIILSIGRLVERKGFDNIIEAMESVLKKVPEVVYMIGGDGVDRERLKQLSIKAQKSQKYIRFLGEVSNEEKWVWMEVCDVFVMPARQVSDDIEGFGIVYLEANMCGKAVIAGNIGGAKEAVVDGETGLLVNPENVVEISQAIIKLLNNKKLADKLGGQGKNRVVKDFLWEQRGKEMNRIFN